MGRFRGKVLYPFVLFSQSQNEVSDQLFRHELEHIYQIRRDGFLRFYLTYLYHAIRYGYKNIPYEIEARDKQDNPLTPAEKKLKTASSEFVCKKRWGGQ